MTNRYVLIGIAQRLSVFAPHTWYRRIEEVPEGKVNGWGFRWRKRVVAIESQQPSCQRQAPVWETVGEQPEVAGAHEAFGQHMEEEAAQKLGGR